MVEQILFVIFSIIVLGGGLGVVSSKNLYYAALFLTMSFTGIAGFFIILNAGFLAAVQIVVYVGAIAILILFAIMLSRQIMTTNEPQTNRQNWLAVVIVPLFWLALVFMLININWPISDKSLAVDSITQLGIAFLGSYLIPFEVVSIVLLVALVGAIILARDLSTE